MYLNFIEFLPTSFVSDKKDILLEAEEHLRKMLNQFQTYENDIFIVAMVQTGNGHIKMAYRGEYYNPLMLESDFNSGDIVVYRLPNSEFINQLIF